MRLAWPGFSAAKRSVKIAAELVRHGRRLLRDALLIGVAGVVRSWPRSRGRVDFGASSAAVSRAARGVRRDLLQESRRSPPSVPDFSRVDVSAIIAAICRFHLPRA